MALAWRLSQPWRAEACILIPEQLSSSVRFLTSQFWGTSCKSNSSVECRSHPLRFRAIALSKWLKKNNNRDPRLDGHIVKEIEVPGEGLVSCVLLRSLPDDEWDVKLKCSLASLLREQVDSGSAQLRHNQEEIKHAALAQKMGQAFVVDGQKPKTMEALEAAGVAGAAAAGVAEEPGAEGCQQHSSDDGSSDEDDDPLRGAAPNGLGTQGSAISASCALLLGSLGLSGSLSEMPESRALALQDTKISHFCALRLSCCVLPD